MNRVIKISIGLILLVAFSNAQAILVSRLTIEREASRFNEEETFVGKFKFKDDISPGLITIEDIVSFKWINGSLFEFDKRIWNDYMYEFDFRAILKEDGNIVFEEEHVGLTQWFYISTWTPWQLSEEIFGYDQVVVYLSVDNYDGGGKASGYCNTTEGPIDCDNRWNETDAFATYSFTPLRVPEPSTGLLLSLGLIGIFARGRLRSTASL